MLDESLQKRITPALQWLARRLVRWQIQANSLTWTGFGLGVLAALAIALQHYLPGLCLILLSRLLDGLDGAVARLTTPTDSGSFLDITLDFLFYALIPLAFAVANPAANALAAAVLLAGFMGTASSFLAFAVLAAQRGLPPNTALRKGFYFLGGLTEASETLLAFAAMCWWPQHFAAMAYGFAALCAFTIFSRIHAGLTHFQPQGTPK